MTFKDFLGSSVVKSHLQSNFQWWTDYIYHFSDIKNVASILNLGILKSRNAVLNAPTLNYNDNASLEVIAGTNQDVHNYVRFYFRPLTPTQYNNEGIKNLDDANSNSAHCPIPVFLLFDTSILDDEHTLFTHESLASHYEVTIFNGLEDLVNAPLNHIYHTGPIPQNERETVKKRRHAEVIIRNSCNLTHLKKIVCRTNAEKEYLLSMLNQNTKTNYENYVSVIEEERINEMFFCKNLMIKQVNFDNQQIKIYFNKTENINRRVIVKLLNKNTFEPIVNWDTGIQSFNTYLDVNHCLKLTLPINRIMNFSETGIAVYIDNRLCYWKNIT